MYLSALEVIKIYLSILIALILLHKSLKSPTSTSFSILPFNAFFMDSIFLFYIYKYIKEEYVNDYIYPGHKSNYYRRFT
jgi:hypothetical protein